MSITPTTWNPSDKSADITLSNGNLTATETALTYNWNNVRSIFGASSGKFYWEITISGTTQQYWQVGIADSGVPLVGEIGADVDGYGYRQGGDKMNNGVWGAYGNSYTTGDIISIALDMNAGKLWWAKNGVWQASGDPANGTGEAYSGISGIFYAMACIYKGDAEIANFGASAFSYSVPSGFTSGFGEGAPVSSLTDLPTEVKAVGEIISDLLSSIITGFESLTDLKLEMRTGGISVIDLKSSIAADLPTNFANLSTEISVGAQKIVNLFTEVRAGNQVISDLRTDTRTRAQIISDLKSEIQVLTYNFRNLQTSIEVLRSKWWLNTEIKAGCAARWNFNTEWNPNRFLYTQIAAKKPYNFNFKTQSAEEYVATEPSVEFKIPEYSFPLRTLFLDYIAVGGINEYQLELWWARGLIGTGVLKNAKIKAEYINTQYSGGYEVVTCDWLSCAIEGGEYKTINETPLFLGDIQCDSCLNFSLKVECRDCSLTRGIAFFKLNVSGDYKESIYGDKIVYQDGSRYHAGEYDDYQSIDFICRLYVV